MDSTLVSAPPSRRLAGLIARKVATLVIVTFMFGWLYAWASPWAFPPKETAGFAYGMLHGAMMPLSLPSLVTGHDVQIYDANNAGAIYKIGYICGVDICGIAFIGPLFWRPNRKSGTSTNQHSTPNIQ